MDSGTDTMTKEDLIKTLQRVLKTESDLNYLMKLTKPELENLIACIRDRAEHNKT